MTHRIAYNFFSKSNSPSVDYIKNEPLGGFEAEDEDKNRIIKLSDNINVWTCVVCKMIPLIPSCINCGHLVCSGCSGQIIEICPLRYKRRGKTCPYDDSPVGEVYYPVEWGKFEKRLYNQIIVKCPFNCGFQKDLSEISIHMETCTKKPSILLVKSIKTIERANLVSLPTESNLIICPICYGVPRDIIVFTTCGHLQCNECCVRYSIASKGGALHCALCRTHCEYQRLSQLTPWIRRILLNITVKCSYKCGAELTIVMTIIHEGSQCAKRPVYCSHKGCNANMKYEELQKHEETCSKKRVHCPKCLLPILVGETHDCIERFQKVANELRERVEIGDQIVPYWCEGGKEGEVQKRKTIEDFIRFVRGFEGCDMD